MLCAYLESSDIARANLFYLKLVVDRAGFEPAASVSFGWTCEGGVCTDDYAVVIHARLNYRPTRV